MTKKRRVTPTRPTRKKPAASARATKAKAGKGKVAKPAVRAPLAVAAPPSPQPTRPDSSPAAPRRPAYYEAIALYESGVRALQKHDFQQAATQFKAVLDRYPEERELHERARLYLRVCERETAKRPAGPQTPQERVYAATLSLNAGDHAGALEHLRRALDEAPDHDYAHYIMAVALTMRGQPGEALGHLRRAVSLNPDNRALARQDPDLEPLRADEGFQESIDASPAPRRRTRPRAAR
jgi:tetratricopeptide (TPR) repeat protein